MSAPFSKLDRLWGKQLGLVSAMQVGVPVAGTSASAKTRHSAVAKAGTYETLESQHLRNKPMSAFVNRCSFPAMRNFMRKDFRPVGAT